MCYLKLPVSFPNLQRVLAPMELLVTPFFHSSSFLVPFYKYQEVISNHSRVYHSHWSSTLFNCFCHTLCMQSEGAKQQGLLPYARKECTTAGMKEEVTKVTGSSERKQVGNGSSRWVMERVGDQPLALTHALKSVKHAALGACCFTYISSFLS